MPERKEILICLRGKYLGVIATLKDTEIYLALFQSFTELTIPPTVAKTE